MQEASGRFGEPDKLDEGSLLDHTFDRCQFARLEDKVSSIASGANGPACEGAISRKTTAMVRARSSTLGVDNQLPVRRHSFVDTSTSVNEVSSDRDQCDGLDQGGLRRSRSFSGKVSGGRAAEAGAPGEDAPTRGQAEKLNTTSAASAQIT